VLRNALASLRYRKARLALSSLAIVLGVAFVTGTLVMGASMNAAYFNSFAAGAKNVDAAVTPPTSGNYRPGSSDAPSVPASMLARIRLVPGVASADGRLVGQAPLLSDSGKVIQSGELAGFGISNTLTLSVIERTRESALMRALGLTRGQLRRMLLTEALYMALLAVVLGVGLGAAFGWAMVDAFIKSAGGGVISIPFAEIGLFVVIGAVAALLAAVLPARRAAQVSIVGAMADVG
jgi:ABC-type antimicrobial peptide transport system permease subunit